MSKKCRDNAFFFSLLLSRTTASRSLLHLSICSSALESSSDLIAMLEPKRSVRDQVSHFERISVAAENTQTAPQQAGVALPGMTRIPPSRPVLSVVTNFPPSTTSLSAPDNHSHGDGDPRPRSAESDFLRPSCSCRTHRTGPFQFRAHAVNDIHATLAMAVGLRRLHRKSRGVRLRRHGKGVSLPPDSTRSAGSSSSDDLPNRTDSDVVFSTYMRLPRQPDDVDEPPEPAPDA